MPIPPIGAINIPSAASIQPPALPPSVRGADAAGGADAVNGGEATGNLFTDTLKNAANAQRSSDAQLQEAATGRLDDLSSVMSVMTEAQLATQLTVAVRNRAVESFNEIMRMQL